MLEGKVAVISGAGKGQGRNHALTLAREGADIIAIDVCRPSGSPRYVFATPDELEETARQVKATGRRVVALQADVRDRNGLQAAVDEGVSQLGRLDIAVANAGISTMDQWAEVDEESWADTIDINLTGVWHLFRAATPHLIAAGGGAMVATSSTAGLKGLPFYVSYTASKHGVVGIVRSMAVELAKHKIRVNSIHPTGMDTDMMKNLGGMEAMFEMEPALAPLFQNLLPTQLIEMDDVSRAIVYLVGETGRFITGVQLPVDAGYTTK
jgi:SDR family mycofactocin-dependent oxidoreductase